MKALDEEEFADLRQRLMKLVGDAYGDGHKLYGMFLIVIGSPVFADPFALV
jgi:hypothetical protein